MTVTAPPTEPDKETAPSTPQAAPAPKPKRPGMFASLKLAMTNRRLATVALQSFASGLPLGLVWIAIPTWLKSVGKDTSAIGFFTLSQAPWMLKFLWAPLMDRYAPPFLGRKRSWMLLMQLALIAGIAALAYSSLEPDILPAFFIALFIAFASASLDIVIDGYAVEALEKDEQGKAVGARVALYRLAMYISGGFAITAGAHVGWPPVYLALALLYGPLIGLVLWSKEPPFTAPPPTTLWAAIVEPLITFFRKQRAIEILLFIVLFKIGENLATALIRPFLVEKGFTLDDVGLALTTVTIFTGVGGTVLGGLLTDRFGMGRTLWIAGIAQALGCLAYAVVDQVGGPTSTSPVDGHRLIMYVCVGGEQLLQGMGGGALGVLMLRLTAKQFSATQFALLSSLMALPRVIAGPFAGVLATSLGWTAFFVITVPVAVPGLIMLRRFVPLMAREAKIDEAVESGDRHPLTPAALASRGAVAFVVGVVVGFVWLALLGGMGASKKAILASTSFGEVWPTIVDNIAKHASVLVAPATPKEALDDVLLAVFGLVMAGATCALIAARRGIKRA